MTYWSFGIYLLWACKATPRGININILKKYSSVIINKGQKERFSFYVELLIFIFRFKCNSLLHSKKTIFSGLKQKILPACIHGAPAVTNWWTDSGKPFHIQGNCGCKFSRIYHRKQVVRSILAISCLLLADCRNWHTLKNMFELSQKSYCHYWYLSGKFIPTIWWLASCYQSFTVGAL